MVYCGQMRVGMCLCPSSQYKRFIISKFPRAVKRSPAPDGAFFLPSPSPAQKRCPKPLALGTFFVLHVRRPHPCGDRSGAYAAAPLAGAAAYTPEGPPAARGWSLRLRDVYVSIKRGDRVHFLEKRRAKKSKRPAATGHSFCADCSRSIMRISSVQTPGFASRPFDRFAKSLFDCPDYTTARRNCQAAFAVSRSLQDSARLSRLPHRLTAA